jgi:hypothetical protein
VIDRRLSVLGFEAIPLLKGKSHEYLIGADVTKHAVMDALTDLGKALGPNDIAIVYYGGHANIPPANYDLMLSVYDRPLASDEGVRLSDALGTLMYHHFLEMPSAIKKIPRIIVVLDACYSGNAASNLLDIAAANGLQQTYAPTGVAQYPPQIVILAATAPNSQSRAYPLDGTPFSAFGAYFARALGEDWSCADKVADGILTARELQVYLHDMLNRANTAGTLSISMTPTVLHDQSFVAYQSTKYFTEGERNYISEIQLTVDTGFVADVTLPSGTVQRCVGTCKLFLPNNPLSKNPTIEGGNLVARVSPGGLAVGPTSGASVITVNTASLGSPGHKVQRGGIELLRLN